ncbi:MAG: hypothetical protein HFI42_04790 [Lachnospiraceae bacterium]|nr:hypothetical protein [Lachnospiraceae bacterium]
MKNQTSQGVSYLLFAVLVVQGIDYSRFIGMWCNIDLKNWDSGYYTVAIIGQDNQYLYFYQADRNKYQKVIVSSITTDSIQIKDNNSVVIINKKDIVGIVES